MIDLELQSVSYGWEAIWTPDDVDFILRTGDTSRELWASVQELVELYARLRQEQSGDVLLGSSAFAEVAADGGRVRVQTRGTVAEAPMQAGFEAIERLLVDAFSAKDANGGTERRNEKLAAIERHLGRKGVECDVAAVYDELVDGKDVP